MTTQNNTPCQDAYINGLIVRKKHPFLSGSLYKIKEIRSRLGVYPDNLINIGKCSIGIKRARLAIKKCLPSEIKPYTKKMPRDIAYRLGVDVVGALANLKHDGFSRYHIDRITGEVTDRVESLVCLAERASDALEDNWEQSAIYLACDEGEVHQLIQDTLALLDWIIGGVPACKYKPGP
jgi:hypothetical protein